MDPKKALRQAVATVLLPSATLWGGLAILYSKNMAADEWPLWILFFALPLPLIFPIYKRYLKGRPAIQVTRYTVFSMLTYFVVSALYVVAALIHWRLWDSSLNLFIAATWFGLGIDHSRRIRASRAESNQ